MGFFSDIWDSVSDVVTNVVKTPFELVSSPFLAVSDIIEGKNVGDVIKTRTQQALGATALTAGGLNAATLNTDFGKKILNDPTLNKLTFGYTGDYSGALTAADKAQSGQELSKEDYVTSARFGLKTGVAAAAVVAAPALGIGASTGLTGVAAGSALLKGDYAGAFGALSGFLPPEVAQAAQGVKSVDDYFNRKPANASPPTVSGYSSNQGGYDSGLLSASGDASGLQMILIGGVALAAVLLIRKHQKGGRK